MHFIGPARDQIAIDSIDKCFEIAQIIRDTGEPNYRGACCPIACFLNIKAWEKYLVDYPDKWILQYLNFGFPLSLKSDTDHHNQNVTIHYSTLPYPKAVDEYLQKEIQLEAMLGLVNDFQSNLVHCSPLMIREKDLDKRRVILDLSYPKGLSVNDHVGRSAFDDIEVLL